ncbi:hypothetical protein PHJA_001017300 [Phtheirospermum japonicum]|uniref:Nodulin-related protein 1 n=1 Tax=Phtheirospermum japonicum TaxID=374723 RepID=A0A830BPI3_9LAMI|nr:hypothetical protein PHJA_001017300 [Phtheirospermum japonicum]
MNFLSSFAKGGDQPKPDSDQPSNPDNQAGKSSNYDLLGSAKVVADAAQAQFRNEPEKYDKTKVSGAAADLLGAASEYGKLDETKGVGQYVDQAETYLRQYSTSAAPAAAEKTAPPAEEKTAPPAAAAVAETTEGEKPAAGAAAGDYVKMAQGFLNKPSGEGESTEKSEGGYGGDLMKMAGGFLNK